MAEGASGISSGFCCAGKMPAKANISPSITNQLLFPAIPTPSVFLIIVLSPVWALGRRPNALFSFFQMPNGSVLVHLTITARCSLLIQDRLAKSQEKLMPNSARKFGPLARVLVLALAASFTAHNSVAQNSPSSAPASQAPDSGSNSQSQDQSLETLKVNVEVVQLFFNVKDKHGALIPNLNKTDFDLSEDGHGQVIKYFKAESDLPLTLGMLIDSSGSQQRVLDMEKEVGASFLESTLRQKDEAFVISFDVDITLLQNFTNSISRLRHALNEAKINTGGVSCSGGPIGPQGPIPCSSTGPRGTALYDQQDQ